MFWSDKSRKHLRQLVRMKAGRLTANYRRIKRYTLLATLVSHYSNFNKLNYQQLEGYPRRQFLFLFPPKFFLMWGSSEDGVEINYISSYSNHMIFWNCFCFLRLNMHSWITSHQIGRIFQSLNWKKSPHLLFANR